MFTNHHHIFKIQAQELTSNLLNSQVIPLIWTGVVPSISHSTIKTKWTSQKWKRLRFLLRNCHKTCTLDVVLIQSVLHFTIPTWTQSSYMHQLAISRHRKTSDNFSNQRLISKTLGCPISWTQALANMNLSTKKQKEHLMPRETRAISFLKYQTARIKRRGMLTSQDPDTTTRCSLRQLEHSMQAIQRLKTRILVSRVQLATKTNLIAQLTELTSGEMSWMLLIQSRLTLRIRVQELTFLTRRRVMILRADF